MPADLLFLSGLRLFLFSLSVTSQTWPWASGWLPALTSPWQALLFHCCLWPRRTFEFTGFRTQYNYVRKKKKKLISKWFLQIVSALGVILAVFLQLVSGYWPPKDANNISTLHPLSSCLFVRGAGASFTHILFFEASVVSSIGLTWRRGVCWCAFRPCTHVHTHNILCSFQSTTSFLRRRPLFLWGPKSGQSGRPLQGGRGRWRQSEDPSPSGGRHRRRDRRRWALGTVPGEITSCPLENWAKTRGTRVCKNKRGSGWGMGTEKKVGGERQSREGIKGKEGKQLVALFFTFDF